ncbi:hypothetical protein I8748_02280 [Nostoc sp. CENA67]|uniref:Uncharacterized protein n=1 Tax=Amazonocrinis nigriterrae CENA67 TaxID=2794033 RepID=A0A8J7L7H2_9NOST|nr:hypothetical protein [Amazonocrinis nigriterrae]MBH8561016.1 hypothetical protein [Amazonocrinis nigriterrae CENA67]
MKINLFRRDRDDANTAKRQLLLALRRRDRVAINTLIIHWQKILGGEKLTDVIVKEVMSECDSDSYRWFFETFFGELKYQEIQEQSQNNVFRILVNSGLEPGKDFSFGIDGNMIISDRAKETLLNQLPLKNQKLLEAQLQSLPVKDPIIAIEKQLGCAFFTNLTKIASQKVQLLSNSQAAAYLGVLLAGLVKRHPALQDVDFPTRFIFNVLQGLPQERAMAIMNDEQTDPKFDESIIYQDLIASLAEHKSHSFAEGKNLINPDHLTKLDLVWCGERRISEIVAMIEDWHQNNR